MQVEKGSEFYHRSMKSWLEKNDIEMYSRHNEGKSVISERSIRTLKNKIYKYMTSISKNAQIDKLDGIVNKYNYTYHSIINVKPSTYVDVKPSTYIDSSKKTNDKNPKFKIGDIVRISIYKNIFAKDYVTNWSEEVSVIKKVKSTVLWTYVISDLKSEEIVGTFYEKELLKTNQKELRVEKVITQKAINYMLNGRATIVILRVGLIKRTQQK